MAHAQLNQIPEIRADLDEARRAQPERCADHRGARAVLMVAVKADRRRHSRSRARAQAIDPNSAPAYVSRGVVQAYSRKIRRRHRRSRPCDCDRAEARQCVHRTRHDLYGHEPSTTRRCPISTRRSRSTASTTGRARPRPSLDPAGQRSARACADINAVLEKEPTYPTALLGRGIVLLTSGQFDRAIIALGQIVETGIDDGAARLIRARAYLVQGRDWRAPCRT